MVSSYTLFLLTSVLAVVAAYPNIHDIEKFTEADAVANNPESSFNTDWFNQWINGLRANREGGLFNYFFHNEHKENPVNHYNEEERLTKLQPPTEAYNYEVDYKASPNSYRHNVPNHLREHGPNQGQNPQQYKHNSQIEYDNLLNRLRGSRSFNATNSGDLKNQSPINIENSKLTPTTFRSKLKWRFYGEEPTEMFIENTGHTAQLTAKYRLLRHPSISNGPLNSTYYLQQIHFHWGATDRQGSEHTVDGHHFPLEMHVVHYNQKYSTFENAVGKPDGLAVVAFMGEIISSQKNLWPNKGISFITSELQGLAPGTKKSLRNTFPLDSLLVPFYKDYITYAGSLTTPEYQEGVTWLISSYALSITKTDVKQFRNLNSPNRGEKILENWRSIQPLNGREVYIVEN